MENTWKEKSQSSNSKLQAVLKICCDFGEEHKVPPGLHRVKLMLQFMATNGHFKSHEHLQVVHEKILFQAFRKCFVYKLPNVKNRVKLAMTLRKKHFGQFLLRGRPLLIACKSVQNIQNLQKLKLPAISRRI